MNWHWFHRSDNAIKNHWHSIAKLKLSTEDMVAMDVSVCGVSDPLLSCTPSQNGGLVGVQPVRLFDTPKMVSNVNNLLHLCFFVPHVIIFICQLKTW